ncbi:flagellar capping protein [Bacterioplanes sanyensis]|uniref:Filament cap protein n=1 Tax=Bacterioplanes sanyensis TaxID=1249553 RepID=A0A222FP93_9GAMM|nr:flagellar filament capping protein FliD [Bacterioplanes sanyensis]ASP40610.1 flagellar capping protein [Bacterioplanes sanyensis]
MASIQSLGLGSGVLTTDLVEQIVNAEKEATSLRLDRREELVDAKITAYGEIQSMMSTLQASVIALSSPSLAGATKVSSSNEAILTATSGITADPGSYSVEVTNTAKAHSLASSTFSSFDEIIGTGELVFSFGEITYDGSDNFVSQTVNPDRASKTITIDESNRTLSGVRDAINNANMGVTASIINDGSGYRLLVTSQQTGKENGIRIQAQDSDGNLLSGGLGALAYSESQNAGTNMSLTEKGQDAQLQVNGLTITRSSNTIDEVISGVTLNLTGADVGKPVTVTVSPDTEMLSENLQNFVTAYNDLKKFVDDLSGYDADKQQAGLLLGDSTMRNIQGQIRSMISQPIVGLSGTQYRSLTELGVNTDRFNDFLLEFDQATFNKAVREERSSVVSILAKSGSTTDSQITYVNDSINTKPGDYAVNITQLATQAKYTSGSLSTLDFSSPVIIDDSNDTFSINVNGTNAAIELTKGSYSSGDELAAQLALQINSNDRLRQSASSVTVEYNATSNNFSITSNKYGASSQVYITATDANTANTLGFSLLGRGTYQGVELTTLNADAFNGRGAQTQIGNSSVAASNGIDFSANNATFSLAVDGNPAVAVTVNADASGQDLNGDGTFGDRQDTLQAIQTAIDATSLNGQVVASFDSQGFLQFETVAEGTARSIEITAVGNSATDNVLGLDATQGAQTNGKDPGLTFADPVEFNVDVDGVATSVKVALPAATYATGNDLATALQTAIQTSMNTDPNFAGVVRGAETATGSRDISTNIDFSTTNAGFTLNVSGVERDILINTDSGDNVADIQAALDAAYGAGVVTAAMDGTGLKLSTVATGTDQYIEVMSDGRGASSSTFGDISTGIDFSGVGQNATFTLAVDGVDINVDVNGNGTVGSGDASSNLTVIQQALDSALAATGQFAAGDVVAKVNGSGNLYFETVAKQGVKTAATFGAGASLEVKNLGGTAAASLGLSAETVNNGFDALGMAAGRSFGYDLNVDVGYNYDATSDLGSLNISIGGQGTTIGFTDLDSEAIAFLGLQDASVYSPPIPKGKDVAGTINGVEATGSGQFLRAQDGNIKAKPGYYLGNAVDFSSPLVIDATNNTFKVKVDGVEAEISLVQPAVYNNGATLAQALEKAINDNATLKAEGLSVKVEYTDDPASFAHQKFGIISNSTGKDSKVEITEVSNEAANAFGFVKGIGDGEVGKDQQGNVDAASGIRLKVTGGALGARGNVSYVTGFADQLKDILDGFLNGDDSLLSVRQQGLEQDKTDIATDRSDLDARILAMETRLKSQFLYNDAIIQKLNTTQDFVKQQFEVLNASKN